MKYDRFGSSDHIIPRFFLVCKGCREKHTHFNKKLFSLNTLFHEGAPLLSAKNCTHSNSELHPPLNRSCTPLMGFYQNYGSLPKKSSKLKGFRLSGKVFHPFPNRKIEPRSSYIVGGVIVTTKTKYRLGGQSAHPRNQDISSEKKKCPFFVPKIRCRQEEHNA